MEPLEFQTVVFNFHDVILMMTGMQCLFFGILLCFTNNKHQTSTYFLAAFLFAHAAISANELMMWGAEFKFLARQLWAEAYFFPGLAYYLDGPLLFLCIRSLVFENFSFRKRDLLHLLPLAFYIGVIALFFFRHEYGHRISMIWDESFVYSASYVSVDFLNRLLRVGYVAASILLISKYRNLLEDSHSNMEKAHISWLNILVIGVLIVNISETILVSSKVSNLFYPISLASLVFQTLGLTGNYASFVLMNLLIFTAIRYFWNFEKVLEQETTKNLANEKFLNPEMAAEVDTSIRNDKIYMDPDITLDGLAESLSIPSRDLSMLINRHFGVNFYEFINRYRIEEAKQMLAAPEYSSTTITDIYLTAGFNSKSVFYTFFKKFEGITPTQFRQSATA